jgi:hypothetical protein
MKAREHFEDLSIDRLNTVSSAITCDLLTQIGYNMIKGHGMKPTTCLQLVLRLRKNVTIPLLPLRLHKNLSSFFEACTLAIALHQQTYNTMKAFISTFNFPTANLSFMCLIKTVP